METYHTKVVEKIENRPGTGHSVRVGVFKVVDNQEEQIGEYTRNYTTLFRTFFPFMAGEKTFALYSPYYHTTRVMVLPSCEDVGGEEPSQPSFCPVDFYVPSYITREWVDLNDQKHRYRIHEPKEEHFLPKNTKYYPLNEQTGQRYEVEKPSYPVSPLTFYPFGFVAGCIWGDDSAWKVQFLDLSQIEKGIIKRDERFGYIELPDNLTLKEAVDMSEYQYDSEEDTKITIAVQKHFNLSTGHTIE